MPVDKTKNFTWRRVRRGAGCAKGSFRMKKIGADSVIRFCCPKGKWRSGYCHGAMKVQAIGKKRRR